MDPNEETTSQAETPGWFTSGGRPCVFTVGELIENMVDNTSSDVAICSVENIGPSTANGDYVLTLRVHLVPVSLLVEKIESLGVTLFTNTAVKLLRLKGMKIHEATE